MERIQKGRISGMEDSVDANDNPTMATMIPCLSSESVTPPLVIPWWLRGGMGRLEAEVEVVFVLFDDMTGMILARADGEFFGAEKTGGPE